jgi:hypothetical protein
VGWRVNQQRRLILEITKKNEGHIFQTR